MALVCLILATTHLDSSTSRQWEEGEKGMKEVWFGRADELPELAWSRLTGLRTADASV